MIVCGRYGSVVTGAVYNAVEFLKVASYTHVRKWVDLVGARPAVKRGRMVQRSWGPKDEQLPNRHSADDFKTKTTAALEAAAAAAEEEAK